MIEIISWKYHENIIVISWENVDFESYGLESIVTRPKKNTCIFHYIYHSNIIVISLPLLLPSRFPSFPLFLYLAWRAVRMAGPWDKIMEISWTYHSNIMDGDRFSTIWASVARCLIETSIFSLYLLHKSYFWCQAVNILVYLCGGSGRKIQQCV